MFNLHFLSLFGIIEKHKPTENINWSQSNLIWESSFKCDFVGYIGRVWICLFPLVLKTMTEMAACISVTKGWGIKMSKGLLHNVHRTGKAACRFLLWFYVCHFMCTPFIRSPFILVDLIEEVSDLVSICFQKSRSENMKGNEKDLKG